MKVSIIRYLEDVMKFDVYEEQTETEMIKKLAEAIEALVDRYES